MTTTRAERYLCCAVAYRNHDAPLTELPTTFESEKSAVGHMMNVLWHEAKESMRAEIARPEDAFLHPVDIDTAEPGIVTSRAKGEVMRRQVPLPTVAYAIGRAKDKVDTTPSVHLGPLKTMEEAANQAALREQAAQEARKKNAQKEIRTERAARKREEQRNQESEEDRQERLKVAREKRAQKKLEKQQQEQEETHEQPAAPERTATEREPGPSETSETETGATPLSLADVLESEAGADRAAQIVMPTRAKGKGDKARYFSSPVPFDRHLSALEDVALNEKLREAVLFATPSTNLVIIHGPPGTGKTRQLASMVPKYARVGRVLCCAPTNVGTANLYQQVLTHCPDASLLLAPSRTPDDTPVTSQTPFANVVCCTVSGRSGPLLNSEKFDVVIVDEAAQCMEAWMWSLLRFETHTIVMAGDNKQLPALTSETGAGHGHDRSMMERLIATGYPVEFLQCQHRMHPHIVDFPNRMFYDSRLQTNYIPPTSVESVEPYELLDVDGECVAAGTSFMNSAEVGVCVKLQKRLRKTYEQVVVITPYQAQARALLAAGVTNVHTIDSFQGREASAVIVSIVRCHEMGFWNDCRRLNVALTRAKHCLRIVGNCKRWTGLLSQLAADATSRNVVR